MDLLEASETQVLAKSLPKFMDYQKHLQWFTKTNNELVWQQRLAFVVKQLKEFEIANA
jgi:hypothetical protein